ncbi:MAG: hypothetical protein NTY81_03770 [Candidatus Staskawiczbacteria bacterium]|nr:hypothetical protein [Candidatus Staskawiczbacteria bacterium]
MQKQKGISTLVGIIIIIAIAIILFGGVFAWQYFATFATKAQQNSKFFGSSQKTNQIQTQTAGWKTYTNSQYGFSIKYPADKWSLFVETPEGKTLHWMQISAIGEPNGVPIGLDLYIQSGNIDSWLSNKATHTRETVYINGLRAEKFYFGRDPKTDTSATYILEKNNLVYVIDIFSFNSDVSQILSTFKFAK